MEVQPFEVQEEEQEEAVVDNPLTVITETEEELQESKEETEISNQSDKSFDVTEKDFVSTDSPESELVKDEPVQNLAKNSVVNSVEQMDKLLEMMNKIQDPQKEDLILNSSQSEKIPVRDASSSKEPEKFMATNNQTIT